MDYSVMRLYAGIPFATDCYLNIYRPNPPTAYQSYTAHLFAVLILIHATSEAGWNFLDADSGTISLNEKP